MAVTYHLVRSTLRLGRATLVASVYMTLQPIGCTAAYIAIHSGELLPHLFTITTGAMAPVAVILCYIYLPSRIASR